MSICLKTACGWSRSTRWRASPDGTVSGSARYSPGRISVEYRTGEDGRDRIVRVRVYSEDVTPGKRVLKKTLRTFPPHLKHKVARIVKENERNYGRIVYGVSLPDGEIVYA